MRPTSAPPELTPKVWVTELARYVDSTAWPHLRAWWLEQCVRRALNAKDPLIASGELGHDYSGGLALLMAIENEVSSRQGDIDGRTARHTRQQEKNGESHRQRSNGTGSTR